MWSSGIFEKHEQLRQEIRVGGGEDRIKKQHEKGKLTARERIYQLVDKGTFHEVDEAVTGRVTDFGMKEQKQYGDGVVTGYGKINGRIVFVISQDFTVCGGAGGEKGILKICRMLEQAIALRAPVISMNDSGGARIEEGICSLSAYSRLFYLNTMASGVIPQIALILGPCAGGASYSPALCDFIFMVCNESQMYLTGPKVVEVSIGEKVSSDELGGVSVHTQISGVAHFACSSEYDCMEKVKRLLSYMPSGYGKPMPVFKSVYRRRKEKIEDFVPENARQPYDVKNIISFLADDTSFLEVHETFAKNIVVGFGRMEGKPVGIVANQPSVLGGAVDCDAADKASRFIRFCDAFEIPLVSLVDIPAFWPGSKQEHMGIIRHGAKLLYAFAEATVPKVCLVMRKAYGGAYCAMNSKNLGADIVYAWPIAEIAVMGAEGAVNILYRKEIQEAEEKQRVKEQYIEAYESKFLNPYFAAEQGFVDEVIHPEETRERICAALDLLAGKEKWIPQKKHGNIPL